MKRLHNKIVQLHNNEGGNIIVWMVCAALLLAGMLWAIIGSGQRVIQKEQIQSSADAAAFSAAVIKAKGLNIIAFCNLVMAMLMAIVMLLRIIKYALIGTGILLSIACFVPYGQWACEPAATVDDAAGQFANWEPKAENIIKNVMKGLRSAEVAVGKVTPVLALAEAYHVGTNAAYAKNFGKGGLLTVTFPLPTTGLPVEDGKCQDLATQAVNDFGILTEALLDQVKKVLPIPDQAIKWFGDGVRKLLSPLGSIMCGGTASLPTTTRSTDCNLCAAKAKRSFWNGNRLWRASDFGCVDGVMPDGTRVPNGCGAIVKQEPSQCTMNSMPSWSCPSGGPKVVPCDNDPDHKQWQWMKFDSCEIDDNTEVQGSSDWPLPLVLVKDWEQKRFVRAFTVLDDTNMNARRSWVAVAAKDKGAAPMLNGLLGMAQAEFFAFNSGHDDLFHMDWRARLVRFSFSDGSDQGGNEGDATSQGVPAGLGARIAGMLQKFLSSDSGAALQDQFLLH
jgi:hypothetical protein